MFICGIAMCEACWAAAGIFEVQIPQRRATVFRLAGFEQGCNCPLLAGGGELDQSRLFGIRKRINVRLCKRALAFFLI